LRKSGFIPGVFLGKLASRLYIFITLVIVIFPSLWIISVSFRRPFEINQSRFLIVPLNIETGNYKAALEYAETFGIALGTLFKNSIIVTSISLILTIIIGSVAGYAFAKFKFKGRNQLFYMTLIGIMIPTQIVIIPIFMFTKYVGLLNTYASLILAYTAFGLPFSVFILRGFFQGISNELIDAARIDGASQFCIFLKIALPLARPAIATVGIFIFLYNWNEFLLALVLMLRKDVITIPVGLSKLIGQYVTPWGQYAALIIMAAVPALMVFLIFQNWFIRGLQAGSIKG